MPNVSAFDQKLAFAGSKIAHMSEELKKHSSLPLSQTEYKAMTAELKKNQKSLSQMLQSQKAPELDRQLLAGIMSYINQIKKSTNIPQKINGTRRSQQTIFWDALTDFQELLKNLRNMKKQESLTYPSKTKSKAVVKIQGIQKKEVLPVDKDLNDHLTITESKLDNFKNSITKNAKGINLTLYKDLTATLKKANLSIVKAKALKQSLQGQYKPNYNHKIVDTALQDIQNILESGIENQVKAGIAQAQANLFWTALREFQTLLQDLESLKKTRGKVVSQVLTDMKQ
jgi:hypothetical protein